MAATITDQRTIIDQCDAIGTWTPAPSVNTADPSPIEATGCLAWSVSNTTVDCYETYSAINFTAGQTPGPSLIYIWFTHRAALDLTANAAVAMIIGDGTNRVAYHLAGSDKAAFRHDAGPAYWLCLILDTANRPSFTTILGSESAMNWSAITQIGVRFKTLAKSIGGSVNCFIDIMRRGAIGQGLRIKGGTSSVPGVFLDVSTADRDTADQKAFGILRRLSAGVYGCQGPLSFGSDGAAAAYFEDTGAVLVFEERGTGNDKYLLKVIGNASYETHFVLNSCIVKSAGPGVECTFTDQYITTLTLNSCTFADLKNKIWFTNTAAATGHSVTGCSFSGCGQIDPGDVVFTGNTIAKTTDANGGLLIDADGTANISDLSFTSDGTGHAIYITATGTYTFTNFTYSGYGADGTTDAVVYNNSGGLVTINVSGGDTPTVRNGSGATTSVINTVPLTVTVKDEAGSVVEGATVSIHTVNPQSMKGAIADDGGSQTDETTAANNATANDMTLLPTIPAVNDAYYFGSDEPFLNLRINIGQNGAGTWTIVWEYYNGATWASISDVNDGTSGFRAGTGNKEVKFSPPTDWATTSVSGINAFWVRARVSSYTSITTQPLGTQSWIFKQIMNELTNASGIAQEDYNYTTDQDVTVRIRKSSTGTRYVPAETSGTVESTGFTLTWILVEDIVAA